MSAASYPNTRSGFGWSGAMAASGASTISIATRMAVNSSTAIAVRQGVAKR
jgi:hypothetical protein